MLDLSSAGIEPLMYLPEPLLTFGYNQSLADPKDGLFLFGPLVDVRKPSEMRVGVIGTTGGIARYSRWVATINKPIQAGVAGAQTQVAFPGFELVFRTRWPVQPMATISIADKELARTVRIADRNERVFKTVDLFDIAIRKYLREEGAAPALWFVVIPEDVHRYCRPLASVPLGERVQSMAVLPARVTRKFLVTPSMFPEHNAAAAVQQYEVDFHNQLKARLLDRGVVLQIVRETTLTPHDFQEAGRKPRGLQDPASVAWNLGTTVFYKADGRPWMPTDVRKGVCYIGLVFKRLHTGDSRNACCGAQMFLGTGDGVVFKGAVGPWYSEETGECHLSKDSAAAIARMVVESYVQRHDQQFPSELFIHAQHRFNDDEWEGFQELCPVRDEAYRSPHSTDAGHEAL